MAKTGDDVLMQQAHDGLSRVMPLRQPEDPELLKAWRKAWELVKEAREALEDPYKMRKARTDEEAKQEEAACRRLERARIEHEQDGPMVVEEFDLQSVDATPDGLAVRGTVQKAGEPNANKRTYDVPWSDQPGEEPSRANGGER